MAFTGAGGSAAAAAGAAQVLDGDDVEKTKALNLSPRQQQLDKRWAYYRCDQYKPRTVAWDGSRVVGDTERDSIALAGYVPSGFYVANSETLPIQFRRPTSPYHLCKVIVDRFTGLLFGQKRHPRIAIEHDEDTEQFVNAVIDEGRLWAAFGQARTFGGATGSAVVGFKLLNGRPMFEVFDSRWCTPKFLDRANFILSELEYRYTFKQEIRDPETGEWHEADFWFRRVINTQEDVIFEPVLVERNQRQPKWVPATSVKHGLGFCPVVWIQNEPCATEIDGDPDCLGIYELVEAIDRLNAQAEKGVLANCDPTTVIATDAQMGEVRKGSNNALKLPSGSQASYMEMSGGGIMQAREQVAVYKEMALEVAQCVLEQPDGTKTATEVERNYAAMLARADKFREQYGEMGIKRLINMILVMASKLTRPQVVNGSVTRYEIKLQPRADGTEQRLGKGPYRATISWPPYFEPNLQDANTAVSAAVNAKTAGLVDDEHAVKLIAPYFQIEDIGDLADKARSASRADQDAIEAEILQGPDPSVDTEAKKESDTAFNGAQVTALVDLAIKVKSGELAPEAALAIIEVAFPVTTDKAKRIVGITSGAAPTPTTPPPSDPSEDAQPVEEAPPQEGE